jgi:hypothetical protein
VSKLLWVFNQEIVFNFGNLSAPIADELFLSFAANTIITLIDLCRLNQPCVPEINLLNHFFDLLVN